MKTVIEGFNCRTCRALGFCEREALATRRRAAQAQLENTQEHRMTMASCVSLGLTVPQLLMKVPSLTVFVVTGVAPIVAGIIGGYRAIREIDQMFDKEEALLKRCETELAELKKSHKD